MDILTFSALAEPKRLEIVELLREKPYSVNEIAQLLKLRQPQASKHLKTLQKARLVTVKPAAQQRIYALNPEQFLRLEDWLNSFDSYWSKKLGKLDNYLISERKKS